MNSERAYWAATGLFCLALSFSGLAHLFRAGPVAEGMAGLGYPAYVMTILGVAKLLGVAALLAPARPLLKEWAYAGFAFNLLGASTSHLLAGDGVLHALPPAFLLVLGAVSYHLRPAAKRLSTTSGDAAGQPAVGAH